MSAVDAGQGVDGTAMSWAFRRIWYVALAVLGLGVTAGFLASQLRSDDRYQATALVTARQLTIKQDQLPRFGEAIFKSGAVARGVAIKEQIRRSPESMIPAVIDVNPLSDTVLFQVFGYDTSRLRAQRIANTAASAFVRELNKPGPYIGTFAVQANSSGAVSRLGSELGLATGLVGGTLLGLIAAVFVAYAFAAWRRPILSAEDVLDHVSAPVFDATGVRTLAFRNLVRSLQLAHPGVYAFLPVAGSEVLNRWVALGFGSAISPPIDVFDLNGAPDEVGTNACALIAPSPNSARQVPDRVFDADRRVVVVMKGTRRRALATALDVVGREMVDAVVLASRAQSRVDPQRRAKRPVTQTTKAAPFELGGP